MKKFEFLEHTADTKFIAYGKSLEEAFANAALATTAVMTDVTKIRPKIEKHIQVEAKEKRSLLYDFLQELIFLLDTEAFLLSQVKNIKIDGKYKLTATLLGDTADNYEVSSAIKAITYNDMFIKEEPGKVSIQVVPDI